jgi:hypothetical protein
VRRKTLAAIVAIALTIAVSVIGQQDPLPVVSPKANAEIPLAEPTVVLAVEPIHEDQPPATLLDAARRNDYLGFDALYTAAKRSGEDVSPYATLHELWTWSVSDPIGAFYGRDLYERLNRAYPGYAAYIADFRIVDDRGNVFYPTSETRKFLMDRVNERKAPSLRVVQASTPASEPKPQAKPEVGLEAYTPRAAKPQAAPKAGLEAYTRPVAEPAPVAQAAAQVTPLPTAQPTPQLTQQPSPTQQPQQPTSGRGLLLLIIGLIGIGLLAVILRTPREEPVQVIKPQQPPANVEPLRKTPTAPPPGDHRAAG